MSLFGRTLKPWMQWTLEAVSARPPSQQRQDFTASREREWLEAFTKYVQLLEIQENSGGADHPAVATTLGNLGMCDFHLGRAEEAEGYYRRALTVFRRRSWASITRTW